MNGILQGENGALVLLLLELKVSQMLPGFAVVRFEAHDLFQLGDGLRVVFLAQPGVGPQKIDRGVIRLKANELVKLSEGLVELPLLEVDDRQVLAGLREAGIKLDRLGKKLACSSDPSFSDPIRASAWRKYSRALGFKLGSPCWAWPPAEDSRHRSSARTNGADLVFPVDDIFK